MAASDKLDKDAEASPARTSAREPHSTAAPSASPSMSPQGTVPPLSSASPAMLASPTTSGSSGSNERFDEILLRLRSVVEKLEGGNLSLEDSLRFFEEGIGLCRRGATILDSAERKVEVLLGAASGPGGGEGKAGAPRTAPFDASASDED